MTHGDAVTLLGLGSMGRALAHALADGDRDVTVWNRSPGRAGDLDVTEATTVADAVGASPVVLICLLDHAIVRSRLEQAADSLAGRRIVNLTNSTPRQARELASWCRERGATYLDGAIMAVPPIIGTERSLLLVSGDQASFVDTESVLGALGRVRFVGTDDGLASLWDLALLTGMYGLFSGFVHAAAMMGSEQVDATRLAPPFIEWIAAMTPSLTSMAEQIDAGRYEQDVASPLAMQARAMPNLVEAAGDAGVRPDLVAAIAGLTQEAVDRGHGQGDFAAVIDVLRS